MADNTGNNNLTESVEEIKMKLEAMRRMMERNEIEEESSRTRRNRGARNCIINGNFMSYVFVMVFLLIIVVSVYAFVSLYYAILKKFPGKPHTEL